jgi:hypothetical protein
VLRSNLHHNSSINIGGNGRAVLVDGTSSTFGNPGCAKDPGFESGGSKFVMTDSLIVRNSTFSNNCGVGLWLDIKNVNYQLYNNVIENNVREGLCIEVSFGGKVYNNSVSRNGWPTDPYRPNGWLWDAGIGIHASPDVEVYGNTLTENFQGSSSFSSRAMCRRAIRMPRPAGSSPRTSTSTTTWCTSARSVARTAGMGASVLAPRTTRAIRRPSPAATIGGRTTPIPRHERATLRLDERLSHGGGVARLRPGRDRIVQSRDGECGG